MLKPRKTVVSVAIIAALTSSVGYAAGFSLYTEGSGAAIGNSGAGLAAEAGDAATGWYNPAGLVFLNKKQAVMSGVGVLPSAKLTGSSTYTTLSPFPPFSPLPAYTQSFTNLDGARSAVVPAVHFSMPLSDRTAFGFSIVSPFGLSTKYLDSSPVRYAATFSELKTINLSPELAGKLSDNFSIGAGLDWQWSQVKFNSMIGSPATFAALTPFPATSYDSESYNKGYSVGYGFHAGAMAAFNENHTRIGLNYQSSINHTFNGFSRLTGPLASPAFLISDTSAVFRVDTLTSNQIELPSITTLSGYHDVNDKWSLLGSAIFTNWHVFNEIQLNGVAAGSPTAGGQFLTNSTTAQDYRNAWRFAVGANYRPSDVWLLRVGGGWDQTPTVDAERDVRLPDASRWALSVGGHYQMRPSIGFDLGYSYLFATKTTAVNKTAAIGSTSTYTVNATTKPSASLIGFQAVWTMDEGVSKQYK